MTCRFYHAACDTLGRRRSNNTGSMTAAGPVTSQDQLKPRLVRRWPICDSFEIQTGGARFELAGHGRTLLRQPKRRVGHESLKRHGRDVCAVGVSARLGWNAHIVERRLPGSSPETRLFHPYRNVLWPAGMPEPADIIVSDDALRQRIVGHVIESIRMVSPFVPRSVEPPIEEAGGKKVCDVARLGKRIVVYLADDLFLVFRLMIAGRFQWKRRGSRPPGKTTLATFLFSNRTLIFSKAGKKKRAALHLIRGQEMLADHSF